MDPFSHILLAYLLGFGIWGTGGLQYVVAAAFAGALPDADVVLYPLSTRFPLLRHRGISHSIVGVTVIATVGVFVVPRILAWGLGPSFGQGQPLDYFLALEIGGLSHVLLDAMDHWSVPIFVPFSPQEYHFDADRIANVGAMGFTVISYGLMLYERGRVPLWIWTWTAWVLLACAVTYFVVRITARWLAGRARNRGRYSDVIPQANPLVFILFGREEAGEMLRLRFVRYHLLRGPLTPIESLTIPVQQPSGEARVVTASEALARTHPLAVRASWILGETHHFGEAHATSRGFDVFWYSLEMQFLGRAAGVLASVDGTTGRVEVRNVWRNPLRVFQPIP